MHTDVDAAAIAALLKTHYFAGMDAVDLAVFSPVFHPEARLVFVRDGRTVLLNLPAWGERLAQIRADSDHHLHHEQGDKRIVSVRVAGAVAEARIEMRYPSARYIDLLHLICDESKWQIISKTFDVEPGDTTLRAESAR